MFVVQVDAFIKSMVPVEIDFLDLMMFTVVRIISCVWRVGIGYSSIIGSLIPLHHFDPANLANGGILPVFLTDAVHPAFLKSSPTSHIDAVFQ